MELAWRETLKGCFCPKLVFLKVIKVRCYICNFFLYLSLLKGFPFLKSYLMNIVFKICERLKKKKKKRLLM